MNIKLDDDGRILVSHRVKMIVDIATISIMICLTGIAVYVGVIH